MKLYRIIFALVIMTFMSPFLLKAEDGSSSKSQNSKYEIIYENGRQYKVLKGEIRVRFKSELPDNKNSIVLSSCSFKLKPLFPKEQSLKYNAKNVNLLSANNNVNIDAVKKAEEPLLKTYTLEFDSSKSIESILKLIKNDKSVETVEPIYAYKLLSDYPPNDPYLNQQFVLSQCRIMQAWEKGMVGDPNVLIGISDIGVLQTHEDLMNSLAANTGEIPQNGIDDDGNGYIDDYQGYNFTYAEDGTKPWDTYSPYNHGCLVAGMAAATTNNSTGIAGTGYKCKLVPIKAGTINDESITNGYESILYAAKRGCKVLNCSWGLVKAPSNIEQSIVDYAVANNVSIVAAGGNSSTGSLAFEIWYPAGYYGVLGVGNVDANDRLAGTMALGSQVKILAPGEDNWGCDDLVNKYNTDSGTSFAAPIVTGVLGTVRAKYPNLSAIQASEFLRQCVDDVTDKNSGYAEYIPGRLNALKAATTDPMSMPGIKAKSLDFYVNGKQLQRLQINQIVDLSLKTKNYLGSAKNLVITLSTVGDNHNCVEIENSTIKVDNYPANAELDLNGFQIKITNSSLDIIYLRFDISGENGYSDFFLMPIVPTSEVMTLSNKVLQFSVSDRGRLGFGGTSDSKEGVGFSYINYGNQLYSSGFLATYNSQIVKAYNGNGQDNNDFTCIQPIISESKPVGIFTDTSYTGKIGLAVKEEFFIAPDTIPAVKIKVTVKNIGIYTLDNFSCGYYFDWDIQPNRTLNRVEPFYSAVPDSLKNKAVMAEVAYMNSGAPYIAVMSYSDLYNAKPQYAGFDVSENSVEDADYISALTNNGVSQTSGVTDIAMLSGMEFLNETYPADSVVFYVIIAADTNKDNLKNTLLQVRNFSAVNNNVNTNESSVSIIPNPVGDYLKARVKLNNYAPVNFEIYDLLGNKIYSEETTGSNADFFDYNMNVSNLSTGTYMLKVVSGNVIIYNKFIKQ